MRQASPAPRYAELADRRWLAEQMADGRSVYAIARQLQTGARTVRDALRRHGLQWPPADADPVDRLAYIDDVEIRARATQRIVEEATALAKRARAVSDAADALT